MDKPGREGDREFFLEAWGGTGSFQTDCIGRGSKFVKGIRLAILGTTQPGKLNEYIQDAIRGGAVLVSSETTVSVQSIKALIQEPDAFSALLFI